MSDYDTDFYAWTQAQAQALRARDLTALDWDHLAEEIADVGKSERRALVSHLRVLLTHLLKWEYQPERRSDSWQHSLVNAQIELQTLLYENPSLGHNFPALVSHAYDQARRVASLETRRPSMVFPVTCPWSVEVLLNPEWLLDKLG